jgi:hypothetical protein
MPQGPPEPACTACLDMLLMQAQQVGGGTRVTLTATCRAADLEQLAAAVLQVGLSATALHICCSRASTLALQWLGLTPVVSMHSCAVAAQGHAASRRMLHAACGVLRQPLLSALLLAALPHPSVCAPPPHHVQNAMCCVQMTPATEVASSPGERCYLPQQEVPVNTTWGPVQVGSNTAMCVTASCRRSTWHCSS